jgi:hypothetical protein
MSSTSERRTALGWAAFVIACAIAMLAPHSQTVPFHWIWISLTFLYGLQRWSVRRAAQDLDGVFERFVRGRDRAGRRGTGLGLAIVRAIVEAHGGRSDVGRGTTFTLLLGELQPVGRAAESRHLPHRAEPAPRTA